MCTCGDLTVQSTYLGTGISRGRNGTGRRWLTLESFKVGFSFPRTLPEAVRRRFIKLAITLIENGFNLLSFLVTS